MSSGDEGEFNKQFGVVVQPDDEGELNSVLDVDCDLDDSPKPFKKRTSKHASLGVSKRRSAKRIHAESSPYNNNNNGGHILVKNILFGSKRKKDAALKYVNKYLGSTSDFSFNNVDEIKFNEIDSKLVGKCISEVRNNICHIMTKK